MAAFGGTYLEYGNPDVIFRYSRVYGLGEHAAQAVFRETLRFLSLHRLHDIYMDPQMVAMDAMWRNFALFTEDYRDFCITYFKTVIPYRPMGKQEWMALEAAAKAEPKKATGLVCRRRARMEAVVMEVFGKETAQRWFVDYPRLYNAAFAGKDVMDVPGYADFPLPGMDPQWIFD